MPKEMPKAYLPGKYEDEIYKKWEDSGFFNPDNLSLPADAKPFTIVLPPPNVTGTLHAGHASMLAIEDILIRFHRMKGERALWVPGTDHAAIATQTKVEKILKKEGTDRHQLGREKFLERVQAFASESHDTIINQCKKMGASLDWSREAYTLDETRTRAVRMVFKMMYDDGLIYRGDRVVNWCPRCHSTLADDEVEYQEQMAKIYTFKYSKDFPISISTTRPETKLGDTAVAVNPSDERYKEFVGKTFEIDFVGVPLKIKIIADRNVDMEFGTGALGVTPAHSFVDAQMAVENDLVIVKVIDEDGKIRTGFGDFSGFTAVEAREKILEKLKENGLLTGEEEMSNNLSICYRCETPIEPLPSLQWFINVNKKIEKYGKTIKELSLEAVKSGVFGRPKINIRPERFEKNYFHWMDNLRDWCISRQIWFGHPIPVYYCRACGEIIVSIKNIDKCSKCNSDKIEQDTDTLDTWFSSGLWTFSTLAGSPDQIKLENGKLVIDSDDFRRFHPTQVMETGYDILFFWVARMILMTTYAIGDIPFYDAYLHGLVLDEKGKKMSKSKGNTINPLDMIGKYGTDATRMSLVMGSTPGNDLRLSEEKIEGLRNFVNKLWNISRYIISNYEIKLTDNEADALLFTLADKWILEKFKKLVKEVTDDLENFNFSQAGESLKIFTRDDLANWYLEASKFEKTKSKEEVLSYVLVNLLKLWHPFMPFITEMIWSEIDDKFLMVESWPSYAPSGGASAGKPATTANFDMVVEIIICIRNARAENNIEPALKVKAVVYAGESIETVKSQKHLIQNLRTGISEIEVLEKGEKIDDAIHINVGSIEIYLIGAMDKEKEAKRIGEEIKNLENIILRSKSLLESEDFVQRAPAPIIMKEQEKLKNAQIELEKLKQDH
jgi:valyl-tRNA synthetase